LNNESKSKHLLICLIYTIMIINLYFTLAPNDIFSINFKKDKIDIDNAIKEILNDKSLQESFNIRNPYS
jgi:hypothetical protein